MAVIDAAGEHIDFDIDRLPAAHVGELGFLEVGDDIGFGARHHRHQLRAGLNKLADAERAVADDAVGRGDDGGIAEVESGLATHRLVVRERRLRLRQFRLLQRDLLHRRGERRSVALNAGARRSDPGRRLLCVLHRPVAGRGEIDVALVLLPGESFVGLIDQDRGLGRIDH